MEIPHNTGLQLKQCYRSYTGQVNLNLSIRYDAGKRRYYKIVYALIGFLVILFTPNMAYSVEANEQQKALNIILQFAKNLCDSDQVNGTGHTQKSIIKNETSAKLGDLLNNLVQIGFARKTTLERTDYVGVLQKDLAPLLAQQTNCKQTVFYALKDRILTPKKETYTSVATGPRMTSASLETLRKLIEKINTIQLEVIIGVAHTPNFDNKKLENRETAQYCDQVKQVFLRRGFDGTKFYFECQSMPHMKIPGYPIGRLELEVVGTIKDNEKLRKVTMAVDIFFE